ncbi:hypothetical protein P3S67_017962 [Capsicum chacoense]
MVYLLLYGVWGFHPWICTHVVLGMHLFGKYEGVLLSAVAQDMQNHSYPLAYCVVDKENDASWGFIFEKLKAFIVDESELYVISDRHVSIANDLARHYPLMHHDVYMRHLGENLQTNHHCFDSLYLYYYAAKHEVWRNIQEEVCGGGQFKDNLRFCSRDDLEPPLESEWSVAPEYLEMQVLPSDFDPKLERRKVKRVQDVLEPSKYKKGNKCSKCKRSGHKRTTCSLNTG